MSLTNPTDIITAIDAKLTASGALPSGSTTWYPEAPANTAAPFFVIQATGRRTKVADGVQGFFSGVGIVNCFVSGTIGQVEAVADAICAAIMTETGLLVTDAEYDLVSDHPEDAVADMPREVTITFQIGIGA